MKKDLLINYLFDEHHIYTVIYEYILIITTYVIWLKSMKSVDFKQ